jgi:hypothetical protein
VGIEIGSIDLLRRPLVRLALTATEDSILALLDTGYNGDLHMTRSIADRFAISVSDHADFVELAGGRIQKIRLGHTELRWLGRVRKVLVHISEDPPRSRPPREGNPVALAGTGLLYPHLALLDFEAGTVEIEGQG